MQKEGKYHFFPSPRLLRSRLKSERSRQPGEERKRRGSHLPTAEPESAAARREQRLCLRSRHPPAPLRQAGPSPGAPRAPAGTRTTPLAAPALAAAAAAAVAPARTPSARRCGRGSASSRAPPPARWAPTCCGGQRRGARPRAAAFPVRPSPSSHSLPAAAPRGSGAGRALCRPAFPRPSPSESVSPEGPSTRIFSFEPQARGSLVFPPGRTLSRALRHLRNPSSPPPGRGPLGLCPRGRGWREAGSSSAPAEIRPPCQVSPTLLQRRGRREEKELAGTESPIWSLVVACHRRAGGDPAGREAGTNRRGERAQSARAPGQSAPWIQTLPPGL